MTESHESSEMLPGMEPQPGDGPVRQAYWRAIDELENRGLLEATHLGLCANLLRLADIIDRERKGYAVAHATAQAHDLMKTLLELVPVDVVDDEWATIMRTIQEPKS
jgi:hypothetical protein